jgi:hypothetical protein
MTTGTSHNPQLTTAFNLFGGGSTPAAPAAPAVAPVVQTARPDLAQRVALDQTPLPPARPGDDTLVKAGFTPDAPSWPTPPPPPSSRDVASALVPATSGIKPVELAQSAFNFDWLNKLFNSQPSQVAYWP